MPMKYFFDVRWRIDEIFTDDLLKSCVEYPSGCVDSMGNFIVTNPGVIIKREIYTGDINGDGKLDVSDMNKCIQYINWLAKGHTLSEPLPEELSGISKENCDLNSDGKVDIYDLELITNILLGLFHNPDSSLEKLYRNGYIIFEPKINGNIWDSNPLVAVGGSLDKEESVLDNPLIYKISDIVSSIDFYKFIKEVNFETSEKDEFNDLSIYYILDKFGISTEEYNKGNQDISPIQPLWDFIDTWYSDDSKPYYHFESTIELEPVSVGLVSPITLYFLDEHDKNVFRKPFIENTPDGYVNSLYFATDNKEIKIVQNDKTVDAITWKDNLTIDISKESDQVEPVSITFGFSAEEEGLYMDDVRVYWKQQNIEEDYTRYYYIGLITFKCKAIGHDERYRTLFANFGIPDPIEYPYVFKEYDPLEEGNDYDFVNKKSKELFLSYDKIFPYIGTYKALVNAVKFLGYNDVYFKEWYQFLNSSEVGNLDKVNYVSIDMRTGETLQSKLRRFGFTYEQFQNMHKLNQLTLVYRLNLETENDDTVQYNWLNNNIKDISKWSKSSLKTRIIDFPKTVKNFDYASEEVLAKLYYLKQWLEKYIIGVNCRIVDVVGEGIYFEHLKSTGYGTVYQTTDIQSNKALTPYQVYDSDSEGAKMLNSQAKVTVSLKEYDQMKFSDIKDLKFKDYIKSCYALSTETGEWSEWKNFNKDDLDGYKPGTRENMSSYQLISAPLSAPFVLDEYLYELDGKIESGAILELNDTFQSSLSSNNTLSYTVNLSDNAGIFVNKNEIYISDPDSKKVKFSLKAPIIRVEKAFLRDLNNGQRWSDSVLYTIDSEFDAAANRTVYRFRVNDNENHVFNVTSDDYFILSPVTETDLRDINSGAYNTLQNYIKAWNFAKGELKRLEKEYDEANKAYAEENSKPFPDQEILEQLDMILINTQNALYDYKNRANSEYNVAKKNLQTYRDETVSKYVGRFEYTEETFYEAPVIKLYNYKAKYVKNGISRVFNINGKYNLIDDLVLELVEGAILSKEIPVTDKEEVLANVYFTNDYPTDVIKSFPSYWNNGNDGEAGDEYGEGYYGEIPDEFNDTFDDENSQWIYLNYIYKNHRQKFYTIDADFKKSLRDLYDSNSNHPEFDYADIPEDVINELYESVKENLVWKIDSEELEKYWKEKNDKVLLDEAWCQENLGCHCKLYEILERRYMNEITDDNIVQWEKYIKLLDDSITLNKNTDLYVNHLGKYTLSVKGFDEFNNIYLNHFEDYVNVYGTRPELNAYTHYDKIIPYNQFTGELYNAKAVSVNKRTNMVDFNKVNEEIRFPKTYRQFGIENNGDKTVTYENISYAFDVFKRGDYVIFNNFTNKIKSIGDSIDNSGALHSVELWEQNYNLDSITPTGKSADGYLCGLVFFDNDKMRLLNNEPLFCYYKWDSKKTEHLIQFQNWDIKTIQKDILEKFNSYKVDKNMSAFLINVDRFSVTEYYENSDGDTAIKFAVKNISKNYPVFAKDQVIKLVYTKSNNKFSDFKIKNDENYIASASYRIKDTWMEREETKYDGLSTRISSKKYIDYQYVVLPGKINVDMLVNHYYYNYLEKYNVQWDSDFRAKIYKEIADNINLDVYYANLNPVSYCMRLKNNGWENNLHRAGFNINNDSFLNDYIDSGYSLYNIPFDTTNAYNDWNVIDLDSKLKWYVYPQDQSAIIKSEEEILLTANDKERVFAATTLSGNKKIYYDWTVKNNMIGNEENILYKFINTNISLRPVFKEKYDVDVRMRDMFGNIIENKGNGKFFVI